MHDSIVVLLFFMWVCVQICLPLSAPQTPETPSATPTYDTEAIEMAAAAQPAACGKSVETKDALEEVEGVKKEPS